MSNLARGDQRRGSRLIEETPYGEAAEVTSADVEVAETKPEEPKMIFKEKYAEDAV